MSNFELGEVVYFDGKQVENIEPEDQAGFILLAVHADKSGTVPVKRVSDGDFQCLPLAYLKKAPTIVKGRFFMTQSGKVHFKATDDFISNLWFSMDIEADPFKTWVSNEVEFEVI